LVGSTCDELRNVSASGVVALSDEEKPLKRARMASTTSLGGSGSGSAGACQAETFLAAADVSGAHIAKVCTARKQAQENGRSLVLRVDDAVKLIQAGVTELGVRYGKSVTAATAEIDKQLEATETEATVENALFTACAVTAQRHDGEECTVQLRHAEAAAVRRLALEDPPGPMLDFNPDLVVSVPGRCMFAVLS